MDKGKEIIQLCNKFLKLKISRRRLKAAKWKAIKELNLSGANHLMKFIESKLKEYMNLKDNHDRETTKLVKSKLAKLNTLFNRLCLNS